MVGGGSFRDAGCNDRVTGIASPACGATAPCGPGRPGPVAMVRIGRAGRPWLGAVPGAGPRHGRDGWQRALGRCAALAMSGPGQIETRRSGGSGLVLPVDRPAVRDAVLRPRETAATPLAPAVLPACARRPHHRTQAMFPSRCAARCSGFLYAGSGGIPAGSARRQNLE